MKVDIEDVLFWMDAIRNADDRDRVLESFWKGQVHSKEWLIFNLEPFNIHNTNDIVIHGGWFGVLASLIFNSRIKVDRILSLDVNPECRDVAYTINKNYEMNGQFTAITQDMCNYDYTDNRADIVINTSCEHITQEQFRKWYNKIPEKSLVVLQSNNFYDCEEHINCSDSVDHFLEKTGIPERDILLKDDMQLQKYTRFLLIGIKNVQV